MTKPERVSDEWVKIYAEDHIHAHYCPWKEVQSMARELKERRASAPDVREPPKRRVVLVCDGKKWYARSLRLIEHDLERDEKIYRCDKPLGNDYESVFEAICALHTSHPREPGTE